MEIGEVQYPCVGDPMVGATPPVMTHGLSPPGPLRACQGVGGHLPWGTELRTVSSRGAS